MEKQANSSLVDYLAIPENDRPWEGEQNVEILDLAVLENCDRTVSDYWNLQSQLKEESWIGYSNQRHKHFLIR